MPEDSLRERWRFMLENAGYSVPPGRAACALNLARAETRLADACANDLARVRLEDDPEPPSGDALTPEEWAAAVDRYGCVGIILETRATPEDEWTHAASLWSIVGDHDYWRVVAAELAAEVL